MKYLTLFFSKIEKMSKNLSSAAVLIGALRVKPYLHNLYDPKNQTKNQQVNGEL